MSEAINYEDAANAALEFMDESELKRDEEDELEEVAILDDASAEYMLRRLREANEQYERMADWYEFQKGKAKAVRDRTVSWVMRSLRAYFDMVPTKNGKTQRSYELPGAKLVLKHQEPKYDQNDELLVPWLKANMPEMVRVKEESNWAELKKALKVGPDGSSMITEDGEIVPGATATERGDKFTLTHEGKTYTATEQDGRSVVAVK